MEFLFDNERPIYIQLIEQLEMHIVSGRLKSGERLPSVREYALISKVNPNTMQRALAELVSRGLIYTERTNGKYVTEDEKLLRLYREKYAAEKVKRYIADMQELGFTYEEAIECVTKMGGSM